MQDLRRATVLHFFYAHQAGIELAPKHHQSLHLAADAFHMGNPRLYANYIDESLNRDLRDMPSTAHCLVFE